MPVYESDIANAMKAADLDLVNLPAIVKLIESVGTKVVTGTENNEQKDTIPDGGARPTSGYMFDNGPFSMIEGDIVSSVASGGSPLTQWIPTSLVDYRFENVKHMEWVAPKDFDGSTSYREWLSTIEIPECGYGPATAWSAFEYEMDGGSFSWSTDNMKVYEDGFKYYQQQPTYSFRGFDGAQQQIENDKDWAVARLLLVMEQHLDYVVNNGDANNSDMEWDGVDTILGDENYVLDRKKGSGVPHWAQPVIMNGAPITSIPELLLAVRKLVQRIKRRIQGRRWQIRPGDLGLLLPSIMWDNMAEAIAAGSMYRFSNWGGASNSGFVGNIDFSAYEAKLDALRNTQIWNVDGVPVQLLLDPNLGRNVTIDPGGAATPGYAGNVKLMTKRLGPNLLLEQQYLDWRSAKYPSLFETNFSLQGGMVRAGWVTEANKCFYYYGEMAGRIVTRGIQYQGMINNVVIPTLDANESEATAFYSPDYYPYNGQRGGEGNTLLTPV